MGRPSKAFPSLGRFGYVVTGTFGDFTITGYAKREGAADSVTAMTYSCAAKFDGNDVSKADRCKSNRSETVMKTADLTESTVFAPDSKFLIVGDVERQRRKPAGQAHQRETA